jgi:hypothetical protein
MLFTAENPCLLQKSEANDKNILLRTYKTFPLKQTALQFNVFTTVYTTFRVLKQYPPTILNHTFRLLSGTAQSSYLITTGGTIRGSNPGGSQTLRTRPDRALEHHPAPVPDLFLGLKRPEHGVDYPPHPAQRLKKE